MSKIQIEQTSKKFKLIIVLCRLAYAVSMIWGMCEYAGAQVNGTDPIFTGPIALFAVALIVSVVNRFMIWWSHG